MVAGNHAVRNGLVAAGSPDLVDLADTYAALTGRRAALCDSVDAVLDLRPDVFIATFEALIPELLDALYGFNYLDSCAGERPAPGILTGVAKADVHAHLMQAAAAFARTGNTSRATEIYPAAPFGVAQAGDHVVIGGRATRKDVLDALSRPNDVLTVVSHGDGVDAFLNGALTVCAMPDLAGPAQHPHTPYCMETGQCFRHKVSVDEAIRSGLTISPTLISARIVVWSVCYGILSPRGPIDPRYGFLPPMLTAGSIGAVVTTSGVALTSPSSVAQIVSSIYQGGTLGAVVAEFNRRPEAIAAGLRFYILGEPDTRASSSLSPLSAAFSSLQHQVEVPTNADRQGVTFLRHYLRHAEANATGDIAARARAARLAAESYDASNVDAHDAERGRSAPGPKLRALLIDFFASRGTVISQDWLVMAVGDLRAPSGNCGGCASQTSSAEYVFHDPVISRRILTLCPACGVVVDAPVDFGLEVSISNGRMRLTGDFTTGVWTIVVRIGCQDDSASIIVEWPSESTGRPCEFIDCQNSWPVGSLRVAVIAIRGASVGILSFAARATPDGKLWVARREPALAKAGRRVLADSIGS